MPDEHEHEHEHGCEEDGSAHDAGCAKDERDEGYELFGAAACDRRLPTNEVTEEFTFGQFVRLRVVDDELRTRTIALRDQQVPEPLRSAAGRDEYERPALLAEVADGHVPARHPNDLDRVFVDDVDGLIAGRRLHVDGRDLEVELDEVRIARLLAGFDVETHVHANGDAWPILLVSGPSAPADAPGTRRVTIGNLSRFLADPTVVGDGGGRFPLRFDRDDVLQLRRDGVATVGDGDHAVTVMYGPASGGAGIEASTDRDDEALEAMSPFGTLPSAADRFALGIYLAWRQTWRLQGYSRSGLLHSLTLAPQEETTIEVFSWDRRRTSLEQSSSFESDESIENSDTSKDVIDVVREMSSSNEFQIQGHAQLNVKYAAVEAEVGVQAGGTDKLNETTRRSTNHLEETTQKAAMRVRVSRQTKISEAAEFGREERVTRKVRNSNLCRTLTLDYFEVLAHYDVRTAFANEDAQICLFVPFPFWLQGKVFTPADLRTHERALRMALIDRALAPAFDGARLLAARDWAMTHVCDKPRCNSSVSSNGGGGGAGPGTDPRLPLEKAAELVAKAAQRLLFASIESFALPIIRTLTAPSAAAALDVQRYAFRELFRRSHGTSWSHLTRIASSGLSFPFPPPGISFPVVSIDEQIALLEKVVELSPPTALATIDIGGPSDQAKKLIAAEAWILVEKEISWLEGPRRALAFSAVTGYCDQMQAADPEDAGLVTALAVFQKALVAYRKTLEESGSGDLDAKRLHDAQRQARLDADADQVRASYPLGETASAAERVDALIAHLNEHPSHYRYALLQALPIGEQMQELARLGVPTDLVEPRILGMVQGAGANDDLLAVPLNTALEPALKAIRNRFLDENDAVTKLCVSRAVRMPTPGTAIEARLGDCDAAEDFVMQTRAIELATRAAQLKALQASARQQELEADRFAQRIADGELEDPTPEPGGLHVTIDKPAP